MLQRYKNILVPVDGSREAELAFKKAVSVAKRNGDETTLHLVHVVDTRAFQNISSFDTAMVDQVTETAKKTMEGYVESAKADGRSPHALRSMRLWCFPSPRGCARGPRQRRLAQVA